MNKRFGCVFFEMVVYPFLKWQLFSGNMIKTIGFWDKELQRLVAKWA